MYFSSTSFHSPEITIHLSFLHSFSELSTVLVKDLKRNRTEKMCVYIGIYMSVCRHTHIQRKIPFKELAYMAMGAAKFKMCKVG